MVAVGGVGESVAGQVGRDATKISAQLLDVVSIGEAPGWTRMDEQENRLVPWSLVHIVYSVSVNDHPVVPERVECIVYPAGTCAICRLHIVLARLKLVGCVAELEYWVSPGFFYERGEWGVRFQWKV